MLSLVRVSSVIISSQQQDSDWNTYLVSSRLMRGLVSVNKMASQPGGSAKKGAFWDLQFLQPNLADLQHKVGPSGAYRLVWMGEKHNPLLTNPGDLQGPLRPPMQRSSGGDCTHITLWSHHSPCTLTPTMQLIKLNLCRWPRTLKVT